MEKPKVLHLIDSNGMYGAENVVLTLLDSMKGSPYNCLLGCIREAYDQEVELGKRAERKGIDVIYFSMHRGLSIKGIINIYKYIKKHDIKIVHSHGYKPNIFLGLIPKKYLKAKIITTIHGWAKEFAGRNQAIYETLNCYFIRRFDRCIAVSKAVYNDMIKRQIPSKKITIIYNGIDINNAQHIERDKSSLRESFDIPKDVLLIGTAGRLVKEKGMDVFIKGAGIFLQKYPNAFFLIAGDGPLLSQLRFLTSQLGIEHKLRFLGFADKIYDFLYTLDIFVLCSLTEGLPIVLLEALSAGCPTICSCVGGIPEVIDNTEGLLIEPGIPNALSEKLLLLSEDAGFRNRIAFNGKSKVVETFSSEKMGCNYINLYNKLMDQKCQ
jgi:glycosyltransferase involved in cell wall biosynthesis